MACYVLEEADLSGDSVDHVDDDVEEESGRVSGMDEPDEPDISFRGHPPESAFKEARRKKKLEEEDEIVVEEEESVEPIVPVVKAIPSKGPQCTASGKPHGGDSPCCGKKCLFYVADAKAKEVTMKKRKTRNMAEREELHYPLPGTSLPLEYCPRGPRVYSKEEAVKLVMPLAPLDKRPREVLSPPVVGKIVHAYVPKFMEQEALEQSRVTIEPIVGDDISDTDRQTEWGNVHSMFRRIQEKMKKVHGVAYYLVTVETHGGSRPKAAKNDKKKPRLTKDDLKEIKDAALHELNVMAAKEDAAKEADDTPLSRN